MNNKIPAAKSNLLAAGNAAYNGALTLENIIGLQHNRSGDIRVDVDGFAAADTAAALAEKQLSDRHTVVRSVARTSREKLRLGREIFRSVFGETYNSGWDIVGLEGSLEIPRKFEEIPAVLLKFKDFLTAHPELEVDTKEVTAARYGGLYTDLNLALSAVDDQESVVTDARALRKVQGKKLRQRLAGLKKELSLKLDVMDSRWLKFGFAVPGVKRKPAAPTRVKVTLVGADSVAVKWDRSMRATHYRIWKKVVGVDGEFVAVDTTAGLDFTLENLPANSTVEIAISAVNDRGESKRSKIVTAITK